MVRRANLSRPVNWQTYLRLWYLTGSTSVCHGKKIQGVAGSLYLRPTARDAGYKSEPQGVPRARDAHRVSLREFPLSVRRIEATYLST